MKWIKLFRGISRVSQMLDSIECPATSECIFIKICNSWLTEILQRRLSDSCGCVHAQLLGRVRLFCYPLGLQPARLLCSWDFSGKNTGVDCHFLLQGILLTQGLNPHLPSLMALGGTFFTTEPLGRLSWAQQSKNKESSL